MTTLMQASQQWAKRPADERFTSLPALRAHCAAERNASVSSVVSTRSLRVEPHPADPRKGLTVVNDEVGAVDPSNWSFGQLCGLAKAPRGFMRELPAPIVADTINWRLRFERDAENVGILTTKTQVQAPISPEGFIADGGDPATIDHHVLRAATGPNYGRIWNEDIVMALEQRFGDGVNGDFKVPGEFGVDVPITKENTTIYGSDRDIFIFLADEKNRVEMKDRRDGKGGSLARGFFVWNSEVGGGSIGLAFFLFDFVCQNRIVWGVEDFKEMRMAHTKTAPDRWLEEMAPALDAYSVASAAPIEAQIKAAQAAKVEEDIDAFLANRFNGAEIARIIDAHDREEGRPMETVWDAVTGVTAYAKTIEHQDKRVKVEREGGKLLSLVDA